MATLLQFLVAAPPTPRAAADAAEFWAQHLAAAPFAGDAPRPFDLAAAGGFIADRLGYAFLAGYGAALQQLVGAPILTPTALCATEVGGAHPKAMATELTRTQAGWEMSGRKSFVTFGPLVQTLLVIAKDAAATDAKGRSELALVRIPVERSGVTIERQPDLPFVPEIPHAAICFERVQIAPDERLPGDGYVRYLKPFRTIEDCHVMAAALGWLVQVARRCDWPRPSVQELLMLIAAGRELAACPPLESGTHVALGGWLASIERAIAGTAEHWALVDAPTRERWERDQPLLKVAGKVRAQRLATAWERLQTPAAD